MVKYRDYEIKRRGDIVEIKDIDGNSVKVKVDNGVSDLECMAFIREFIDSDIKNKVPTLRVIEGGANGR